MEEIMQHYKVNITQFPTYDDGKYTIYKIRQTTELRPKEYIVLTGKSGYFEELSISDTIKFANESRIQKIVKKIRISQDKTIDSLSVLEIDKKFYKVFNAYHFTNSNDFKQSDITLEEYKNYKFEKDVLNGK